MHDYMICIDETGSPYLAHALFGNKKGSQKKDHKWYARENVKGSWRYWYDPESYRKWASGAVNKAKSAVNNAVNKSGIKQRKALNDANKETGLLSSFKRQQAQRAYDKTAIGRAEKAVSETLSKAKESIKPLDAKKRQTLGKIHEKFKDVTLDTIDLFVSEKTRGIRNAYERNNHDPMTIATNMTLFLLPTAGVGKVGFGVMKGAMDSEYNNSIYGKVSRWLDSPIAELHNKKYHQYSWDAWTTDITKPKETFKNAQKAWGERVKRDKAKAKSMQRRGVSPQRLLR